MKTQTFLDAVRASLAERKIEVLATNHAGNCILAKAEDDLALFLYADPTDFEQHVEVDMLSDVSKPYEKTFRYLLKRYRFKLLTTYSAKFGQIFCEKIVTNEEYHNVKRLAGYVKRCWRAKSRKEKVEINSRYSFVSIGRDEDSGWSFQGHDADTLIDEARHSVLGHFCSERQIIYYQSQGW